MKLVVFVHHFCCLSSGGVLVLCPRAQNGDCETRHAWKRRGRHWHWCDLRDLVNDDDDDDDDASLVLWLWLTMPPYHLNGWPFPSFTYPPSPLHPTPSALLCFVAWLNIALYLLHINSVIFLRWNEVALGILIMGVWGSFWLHICCFFFFFCFFSFGPCIFPVNKEWMFCYPPHSIVCFMITVISHMWWTTLQSVLQSCSGTSADYLL